MRSTAYIALLSVLLLGCDRASSRPGATTQQTADQSNKTVEEYVATWSDMGMRLPDTEQVAVFRDDFESARSSLRDALANADDSVRMRAAYVIGEIGDSAKPAGEDLVTRLKEEPDRLVRIYIVDALNAIGYDTDAAISALTDQYEALDDTNVPPNDDHSYAEVDEKTTVASALYALVDEPDSKSEYFQFVTKWLNPPDDDVRGDLLEGYWERRWIAVNSLEQMPRATDAIPLLESLQAEPDAKPWVRVHVPRVLGILRESAR